LCADGTAPTAGRCSCDPAASPTCPITVDNCKGREESFLPCRCISAAAIPGTTLQYKDDPVCKGQLSVDFCKRNPFVERCFCILHKDAPECSVPDPCALTSGACQPPTTCNDLESCTPADYCAKNPTDAKCKCIKDPATCANPSDPKPATDCSTADRDDVTKIQCYCRFHPDKRCFRANGEAAGDLGETNSDTGLTTTPRPECTDPSKCNSAVTAVTSGQDTVGGKITVTSGSGSNSVNADVTVDGSDIKINRQSTGFDNSADAKLSARVVLVEVDEVLDADDDCELTNGDTILQSFDLRQATWTAVITQDTTGTTKLYQVVLTDSNGFFTITFIVSGDGYKIGSKDISALGTRIFFESNIKFKSSSSKLMLFFKLVIDSGTTVGVPDASNAGELTITTNGRVVGTFSADRQARAGVAGDVDVHLSPPRDTSNRDVALKNVATDKVFTVSACFNIIGGANIVYDPVFAPSQYTPTSGSTGAPGNNPATVCTPMLALMASLIAALLAALL